MEKPWKVIAAFIGVFIAGAVFGGFFTLRGPVRRLPPPQQRPLAQLPPSNQPRPQVAGPQLMGQQRSNPITPQLMRQFTKSLKLTPEQRERIQPIVSRAGEDFHRLREENARRQQDHYADVARVNERMYVDVSNLLTPEQQVELQEMRQRIEEKFQAERKKRMEAAAADAAARNSAKSPSAAKQKPN